MLFVFDENYSYRLAEGLNTLELGNLKSRIRVEVTHVKLCGLSGAPDEKVIEYAGKKHGIVLTMDKDFKRQKHYFQLYKEHNTGVVIFKTQSNQTYYWEIVVAFIKRWEDLKQTLSKEQRPFAYSLNSIGLSKMPF